LFRSRSADSPTRLLGRRGEDAAAALLRRTGYRIIERNAVVPMGEADIVAQAPDGRTMVIVEVKSRRRAPGQPERSATTPPEAAVTRRKRGKLAAIARHLARANNWQDRPVRIDVIAVEFTDGVREPALRHHVGICTGA
jgi:putative endonuclease